MQVCHRGRQTAARECLFCALCRWLRCATGHNRPLAHVKWPCRAFRWVSMCGTLAKWGSIVERLGEGCLQGLSGPSPSMTEASVPLAEAPFPLQHLQSIKMMEPILHVVPIIGAGGADCWCRCISVLAQVRKNDGDLRRESRFCAFCRRRSPPFFLTCAKTPIHLHQQSAPPAPMIGTT